MNEPAPVISTANGISHTCDAAIIGGGIIGLASAVELASRGFSVAVLERGMVGCGASHGNAGWLTPSLAFPLAQPGYVFKAMRWMLDPESPFYIRPSLDPAVWSWLTKFVLASRRSRFRVSAPALIELCRWSVDAWSRFASSGEFGFAHRGLLVLLETEHGLRAAERAAAMVEGFGIEHERWDAERVRAEEPIVRGPVAGAVLYPGDAHCEPDRAVQHLRHEAERLGVKIIEHCSVRGARLSRAGASVIETDRGHVHAREIVIAAGFWAGALGRMFDLKIPMRAGKGYSMQCARGPVHPTRSISLAERKVTITPHASTLRIAGTLELVGEDLSINRRRVAAIERAARAMIDLPAEHTEPWVGLRPCLPDGMPAIGRSPKHGNVWLSIGHQMTGLKCAPGSARLLADLMLGATPTFDPRPFDPGRCCG